MKVAIQGELGAFSHEAALGMLGQAIEVVPCTLSSEVFARVADGSADAAVVPIENTLAGSVLEHYDLLLQHRLRIDREFLLRIRHCLIAAPAVVLDDLREVYSHPIALAQCRRFFEEHPAIKAVPFYDTAGAVRHAIATGGSVAGIGSIQAQRQYDGALLAAGIEDNEANFTRFLLLRQASSPRQLPQGIVPSASPAVPNKVSLAFAVPNSPGSLVGALEIFARHGLNLTRLESRPVPGSPWQYVFYADYQLAHEDDADRALAELAENCQMVHEFGRYTAA